MQTLRSSDELLSNKDFQVEDCLEIQLDDIGIDLVKLILDVLEHFDMFRLCMIVCNRYGLYENIGRYLSTICYRYSNLKFVQVRFAEKVNN